jgi:hypothetical protein
VSTLTKEQIDRIVQTHSAGMRRALDDAGGQRSTGRPPIYPNGGQVPNDREKASARRSSRAPPTGGGPSASLRWSLGVLS